MNKRKKRVILYIIITIILAIIFLGIQLFEYIIRSITIRDRTFGALFFTITGFHGGHVLVGVLLLVVRSIII